MKTFKEYLQGQYPYSENTLQEKENQLRNWKSLCLKGQELEKLTLRELLPLIEIQKKNYSISSVNNQLKTLEQYYHYQKKTGQITQHPLIGFRIKPEPPKLIQGLYSEEELKELYESYSEKGHYGGQFDVYRQRNKVILGLLIYQGLTLHTLEKLESRHLHLEEGEIEIPALSAYKLNGRILPLESNQVLALHNYQSHTREELLRLIKTEKDTCMLFPRSNKTSLSSIGQSIKKQLGLVNIYQLRYSRIVLWKKQYNLREVQYKAGYRSILSLEKYNQEELEQLQESIKKYHPF